ncbi:ABC transporter permease [Saccharothrix coeruleofusca]|uniref:ABC transporter permease n=1 Tax=Saccharothrix coeruleofusca TaxID=33919 RepID=A0A918AMH4_9PSEU|nr:ABC-2 family transporter protein [Saccharothrix coeruleofusca]MBP2339263.1 ABC-2 type transport system permease protein [Saccharothrix coeruleofusca]GGP59027.1 ABC transporter permease [Saccharothrix coeruleofusca]
MAERVYAKLVAARLRGQMSYRLSFVLDCLAQALAQVSELAVILVLFHRVRALGGFSVEEVLLLYALTSLAFGLADAVAGQLERLPTYLLSGSFDALLLRPLGTLPQLAVSDIQLRKLGRVVAGLALLGYALARNDIAWSPWTAVLAAVAPLAGAVLFGSVWVVGGAACFWLVNGQELTNSFTYGGSAFASYPITVYGDWTRRLMAFVVPLAFVSYYPGLALLGRPDPLGGPAWLGWISPLVALAAACAAGLVWRWAVRHYRGTGS